MEMASIYESKILIVEDEVKIADLLKDYLKQSSFNVEILHRGDQVADWLTSNRCDLVLLDLMLPGLDGVDICKNIRKTSSLPIIMITAKVEEIDRLIGLEIGADDYICKPFSPREVVARVKAVLRRSIMRSNTAKNTGDGAESERLYRLDKNNFSIIYSDKKCELTKVEFALLNKMAESPGIIFSRDKLMDAIYDDQHIVNDRTIDSHIKKLRKKLAEIEFDVGTIHSVYGAGYKFE